MAWKKLNDKEDIEEEEDEDSEDSDEEETMLDSNEGNRGINFRRTNLDITPFLESEPIENLEKDLDRTPATRTGQKREQEQNREPSYALNNNYQQGNYSSESSAESDVYPKIIQTDLPSNFQPPQENFMVNSNALASGTYPEKTKDYRTADRQRERQKKNDFF